MEFQHKSVLLNETIENLNIKPDGIYVDGTLGGAGHAYQVCKRLSDKGRFIGIDQDEDAIKAATERLSEFGNKVTIVRSNYCNMKRELNNLGISKVDGIVLDLGVSSYQLDTAERGFSFHEDAPLDMRMSQSGTTAAELVNTLPAGELRRILSVYGEEKFAGAIVNGIVKARAEKPIETTLELAEIIKENVPQRVRRDGHPARKSFQALRIAVNDELGVLERGLDGAFELLGSGGRLAVITFHSLEDRIVKQKMASWCQGCTCPKDFPVCVCGNKPKAKLVVRKPVCANETELRNNPRARSAKLRICEKI